jgi:hypothetical protein
MSSRPRAEVCRQSVAASARFSSFLTNSWYCSPVGFPNSLPLRPADFIAALMVLFSCQQFVL